MNETYTCPNCGWTSYNLVDVAEKYCGRCHIFQDDMAYERLRAARATEVTNKEEVI